jgi:hypothetical protein
MEEEPREQTPIKEEDDKREITLEDLRKCLDEERPPTDEKEDIGVDKDAEDFSINSSFSEDDIQKDDKGSGNAKCSIEQSLQKMEGRQKSKALAPGEEGEANISFDDIEDVISNPYAEMPEFYSKQIDFEPIKGLPGNQPQQLAHKNNTALKDKYWDRILKGVFDMATAKVPRPVHLTKMLSLYIIHQERLKEQRKAPPVPEDKEMGKSKTSAYLLPKRGMLATESKRPTLSGKRTDKKPSMVTPKSGSILTRSSASGTPSVRLAHGLGSAASNAASNEIQKRVDKLDKNNIKVSLEELARSTKNVLVRMPPYKKKEQDTFSSPENDTAFMRGLSTYIFSHGFIQKWKGESPS